MLTWNTLVRCVVPFAAAHLFLMVLIYFTVVRKKIAAAYPFYACFLLTFILYLCGPLLHVTPHGIPVYYLNYVRTVSLFAFGMPSLVIALALQSGLNPSRGIKTVPYAFGGVWSAIYLVLADLANPQSTFLHRFGIYGEFSPFSARLYHIHLFQVGAIICLLIVPMMYLLIRHSESPKPKAYLYGVLSLALFMILGSLLQQWVIYYVGSSLTAVAWGWAVFKDIKETNRQAELHYAHERTLAAAQYASGTASGRVRTADIYAVDLDEAYPFREREELLEIIRTGSSGLAEKAIEALLSGLLSFTKGNWDLYTARVREVLFMMTDRVIYGGGDAKELILGLEATGREIDRASTEPEISELLGRETARLSRILTDVPGKPAGDLVEPIKQTIFANYHKECTIDTVAEALGVSRSHVMKTFKKVTGQTVNQFINEVRINKSKMVLLSKSVTDTAFDVGFNNSNYFSTVFKKQTGMTPKEFQRSARTVL